MKKHLVLVGGGHAHMVTLERLGQFVDKGIRVTVIGPSEFHYYSGMGPGMLGGTYSPDRIRFATRKVVENKGGEFVADRVTRIFPEIDRWKPGPASGSIMMSFLLMPAPISPCPGWNLTTKVALPTCIR